MEHNTGLKTIFYAAALGAAWGIGFIVDLFRRKK